MTSFTNLYNEKLSEFRNSLQHDDDIEKARKRLDLASVVLAAANQQFNEAVDHLARITEEHLIRINSQVPDNE